MIDTAQAEKDHLKGISELTGEDATPEKEKPFELVGEGLEVLGNHVDEAAGSLRPATTVGVGPNRGLRQRLAERRSRMKSHGSNTDRS